MLTPRLIARFERCYDAILAEGYAFHGAQPVLVRATEQNKRRGCKPRRVGHAPCRSPTIGPNAMDA
jgi:transposase